MGKQIVDDTLDETIEGGIDLLLTSLYLAARDVQNAGKAEILTIGKTLAQDGSVENEDTIIIMIKGVKYDPEVGFIDTDSIGGNSVDTPEDQMIPKETKDEDK